MSLYAPLVYRRQQGSKESVWFPVTEDRVSFRMPGKWGNWTCVLSKNKFQRIWFLLWPPLHQACAWYSGTHAKPMLIHMKYEWIFHTHLKAKILCILVLPVHFPSPPKLSFWFQARSKGASSSRSQFPWTPTVFLGICFEKCKTTKSIHRWWYCQVWKWQEQFLASHQ